MVVGVVKRPIGLAGEAFVHPDPDLAEAFAVGATYALRTPAGGDAGTVVVRRAREHDGRQVLAFDGRDDRETVDALREHHLVRPARAEDLSTDERWADDVRGAAVWSAGTRRGTVADVLDGHAHDYLVVALDGGGEALVPCVEALVTIGPDEVEVADLPGLLAAAGSGRPPYEA